MAKKTKIRKASPTYEYKTIGKRRSKEKGLSAVAKCQKKGGKWSKGKCVTPAKKALKTGATASINSLTSGLMGRNEKK